MSGEPANAVPNPNIICFHCKKPGHPIRLCPELNLVALMEVIHGIGCYHDGGTESCAKETIDQAFDPDGSIGDPDMVCYMATEWNRMAKHVAKMLADQEHTSLITEGW